MQYRSANKGQYASRRIPDRTLLGLVVLFLILMAGGCGDEGPPPQPTRGQLFINGKPAEGAIVAFHPVAGDFDQRGTCPSGRVGADGSFTLSTYGPKDGVPTGEYMVTILWPIQPENNESADRLGRQYCNPTKSPLRVTIQEGENELEPFRLDKVRILKK